MVNSDNTQAHHQTMVNILVPHRTTANIQVHQPTTLAVHLPPFLVPVTNTFHHRTNKDRPEMVVSIHNRDTNTKRKLIYRQATLNLI